MSLNLITGTTNIEVGLPSDKVLDERIKHDLGFQAYEDLAKKRHTALTDPDVYLKAKRNFIFGAPADETDNDIYGKYKGKKIPGVLAHVQNAYRETLKELYDAGASIETAEKYAKQFAQTVADIQLAIVDMMF